MTGRAAGRPRAAGRAPLALAALATLVAAAPAVAQAQDDGGCPLLCSPEVTVEPTMTVINLFAPPRVVEIGTGEAPDTVRLRRDAVLEMVVAVGIPTALPRLGLTLQATWTPFARRNTNLLTGRTARQLDEEGVADNAVTLAAELNVTLLRQEDTGGWVAAHLNLADQFGPAARPEDAALYTHKLAAGLDASVAVFRGLRAGEWLRRVLVWGSLDYVATGLPEAGEEVPAGRQLFLVDASPWSFSALVSLPVAPL